MRKFGLILVVVMVAFAASLAFGGAGELNFVQRIWSTVSTNLNGTITSRASATDYTATRAGKIDNLDTTISSRAPSSTALSTSTWTSGRAANLDNIAATRAARIDNIPITIKKVTDSIGAAQVDNGDNFSGYAYFYFGSVYGGALTNDYQYGYRGVYLFTNASGSLVDVVNTGPATLYGVVQYNNHISLTYNAQVQIICDGVTVHTGSYASHSARYIKVVVGKLEGMFYSPTTLKTLPHLADLPLRCNTSLVVKHAANSTNILTSVVYVAD